MSEKVIVGVDEAGRGALIGNVVAAAVILPSFYETDKVADSKSLSEQKREQCADYIRSIAIAYGIGVASVDYDEIWVDGKFTPETDKPALAFVKGDALHDCISAASILAKTYRDAELRELDTRYPDYGFAAHKGYPTRRHIEAIEVHGVLPEYRRSYKTIRELT